MKKKLTKKLAVGITVVGLGAVGTQTVQQTIQPLVYANTQSDQAVLEQLKQQREALLQALQRSVVTEDEKESVVNAFNRSFPEFQESDEAVLANKNDIVSRLEVESVKIDSINELLKVMNDIYAEFNISRIVPFSDLYLGGDISKIQTSIKEDNNSMLYASNKFGEIERIYNIEFLGTYEWYYHIPSESSQPYILNRKDELLQKLTNEIRPIVARLKDRMTRYNSLVEYVNELPEEERKMHYNDMQSLKEWVLDEVSVNSRNTGVGEAAKASDYYTDYVGTNSPKDYLDLIENKIKGIAVDDQIYSNTKQELEVTRHEIKEKIDKLPFIDSLYSDYNYLLNKEIFIEPNLTNDELKNAVDNKVKEWEDILKRHEIAGHLLTRADKLAKQSGNQDGVGFPSIGTPPKSDQVKSEIKPIVFDYRFRSVLSQIVNETDPTKNQALQAQAVAMIQFHEDKLNATIETVNRYNQVIDKIMEDPSKSRTLYAKLVFTDYSKYGHFYNAIHLPKATTAQEIEDAKNDILSVLDQFEKEHFGTSSTTSEDKVERLIDKANALIIKSGGTLYDIIQDETPFHDGKSPMVAWDTRIQSSQVKAEVRIVKFNQRFEDILAKMTQETDPAVISQLEKEANDILAFEEARLNATTETVEKYNAIMDKLNTLPEKERHTLYFKLVFTDFGRYGHIYNAIHLPNVRNLATLPKAKEEILAVLSGFEKQHFGTDTPVTVKPDETSTVTPETTVNTESTETSVNQSSERIESENTSSSQAVEPRVDQEQPSGLKVAPLFQDEKPTLEIVDPSASTTVNPAQSQTIESSIQDTKSVEVTSNAASRVDSESKGITPDNGVSEKTEESILTHSRSAETKVTKPRQRQSRILPKTGETSGLGLLGYVMVAVSVLFRVVKKK